MRLPDAVICGRSMECSFGILANYQHACWCSVFILSDAQLCKEAWHTHNLMCFRAPLYSCLLHIPPPVSFFTAAPASQLQGHVRMTAQLTSVATTEPDTVNWSTQV